MENNFANKVSQFVLASLITSYPDTAFPDHLSKISQTELDCSELMAMLHSYCESQIKLDDLRSDYIDIFDRGKNLNPLYETEYERERTQVKATTLSDIAGFYKAFGFDFDGTSYPEMVDHVSVELEFYALLLMKQAYLEENKTTEGVSITLDARKKFLKDHLGRFVGSIAERPGVKENHFYSRVFDWCKDLIQTECQELGVKVIPAQWFSVSQKPQDSGEMCCGDHKN